MRVPPVSSPIDYYTPTGARAQVTLNVLTGLIVLIVSRVLQIVCDDRDKGAVSEKGCFTAIVIGFASALSLAAYVYAAVRKIDEEPRPRIRLIFQDVPETQTFQSTIGRINKFPLIPWTEDLGSNTYLALEETRKCIKQTDVGNFEPFSVQGTTYHAFGPAWWSSYYHKSMADFVRELTKFDLVVNLVANLPHERKLSYTDDDRFKSEYPLHFEEKGGNYVLYSSADNERRVLHITNWKDGTFDLEVARSFIPHVRTVVEALKNNERVFIHCLAAMHRTPLFIVMCQLIMCGNEFIKMGNSEARGFIIAMLREMAYTAYDRFPNPFQLTILLCDNFINLMRDACQP